MPDFVAAHLTEIVIGVIAIIAVLIALAVISALGASKKRRKDLQEWAFRHGFEYIAGPIPANQLAAIPFLELNELTNTANASNILRGSRGGYVTLFDFIHTSRQRKYDKTIEIATKTTSCALFQVAEPLPRFDFMAMGIAEPNTLQGKMLGAVLSMAKTLDGQDGTLIPIEDRPGFLLRAFDQPERVQQLFANPHFFDDKCGFSVRAYGKWLLISCDPTMHRQGWGHSGVVAVKNYDEYIDLAEKIYDHFRHSSS